MIKWLRKWRADKTSPLVLNEAQRELQARVDQYVWYHEIELEPGVRTRSEFGGFADSWAFIKAGLEGVNFRGRRVLDVGCRDGMFSFEAERRGAASVDAIDNDLSRGALELLIPHFKSRVQMRRLNMYDLDPAAQAPYDLILFFGVLYHLRYPYRGLRTLIDCLAMDGELVIESAMLVDTPETEQSELLYCPVENSPYEKTSCTFFNRRALETTLRWWGLEPLEHRAQPGSVCEAKAGPFTVERRLMRFRKRPPTVDEQGSALYWDGFHAYHSHEARHAARANGNRPTGDADRNS